MSPNRTSFTSSEWQEFVEDVGEDDAWRIANQIWNKERKVALDEYKQFLESVEHNEGKKSEALDLLTALYALYSGNTKVYRELMSRLHKLVYELGYEPIVDESDLMYQGGE